MSVIRGPPLGLALVVAAALTPLGSGALAARSAEYPNPAAITIPAKNPEAPLAVRASPYPSEITVSGAKTVSTVTVTIHDFEHEDPFDAEILLVGPTGVKVILMARIAGEHHEHVAGRTYTFDDAAAASLPQKAAPPPSGRYRPTSYRDHAIDPKFRPPAPKPPYQEKLSAFKGTDPDGVWKLFVIDTLDGRGGKIAKGWALTINGGGGGPKPTMPTCNGRKATIVGKGKIDGTLHPDVIVGSEGNDRITGRDSDDTICGLGGNDYLSGGGGHDAIDGGKGKDDVRGGDGNDAMTGGDGVDKVLGFAGNDRISGGTGNDRLFGAGGNDLVYGEDGKDELRGGAGNDFLSGGPHGDVLAGNGGVDELLGGGGYDRCERAENPGDAISCEEILNP